MFLLITVVSVFGSYARAAGDLSRIETYRYQIAQKAETGDEASKNELRWIDSNYCTVRDLFLKFVDTGADYEDAVSSVEADIKNGAIGGAENRRMLKWLESNRPHIEPILNLFK